MTRKFSSVSVQTTLASGISNTATSMTLATGTAAGLMGGVTLTAGNVDQFTVAIDPDTISEEIVFVTGVSGDTLTIVRGRAGSSAVTHSGGATIKHVLTSDDLDYFTATATTVGSSINTSTFTNKGDILVATSAGNVTRLGVGTNGYGLVADSAQTTGVKWAAVGDTTTSGTQTLTNKTISLGSNTVTGTTAQFNTALTDDDFATLTNTVTLTNKTLTAPTITAGTSSEIKLTAPKEFVTVSATAATGTINYDAKTQGVLYYQNNATANFTLNFRGNSTTTLASSLGTGDAITVLFMNTNGTTAYYPSAFQIDGTSVTPKWQGGTAPTAGNASAIDIYSFTIIKTASTPTYVVFASQTKFA